MSRKVGEGEVGGFAHTVKKRKACLGDAYTLYLVPKAGYVN